MTHINSKNYRDGKFQNLVPTRLSFRDSDGFGEAMRKSFFGNKKIRSPQKPLATIKFNKNEFLAKEDVFSWFGHSTILMNLSNKVILIDPVFNRASPFSFIGPKPFLMNNPPMIEDLPDKIDIILLTHDHYDHLEYKTIIKIQKNVKMFFVPLNVKKILINWGIPENKIKEFDWYDSTKYENIELIFTPCRHFSGRKLTNRNSTLWGGWIIQTNSKKIFISGDSGNFDEFKKIGKKYGPFDLMFVENGQYDKAWIDIHMLPEQSIQAGINSNAKILVPIHWGKYDLSVHPWKEPIQRFTKEAKIKKQKILTPKIGSIFSLDDSSKNEDWWNK